MPLAELNYSSSHYTPRTLLNEVCKIKITNIALHLHRQSCDFSETAQRKSYLALRILEPSFRFKMTHLHSYLKSCYIQNLEQRC